MKTKREACIMTYWGYNDNYGQILQAYALFKFLENLGVNVKMIKYDHMHDTTTKLNKVRRLMSYIDRPSQFVKGIVDRIKDTFTTKYIKNCPCEKNFIEFKKDNFEWTEMYHTYDDLRKNPPIADYYICGSDMIWAESAFKPNPFFLDFGTGMKKIAYAPSFGRGNISMAYRNKIRPLLKQLDSVSVREISGISICKSAGRPDTICVPDPTLLLSSEEYADIESPINLSNGKPFIFSYILGNQSHIYMPKILEFAKLKEMDVKYRNGQGGSSYDYPQVFASPGQWLTLIKKSSCVITNSFHGVLFSIIYRRPFLYLPLMGKGKSSNERVLSILSQLGLTDRIFKGSLSNAINLKYDEQTLENLNQFIDKGKKFLINSLQ